jgi:hypothetical protein
VLKNREESLETVLEECYHEAVGTLLQARCENKALVDIGWHQLELVGIALTSSHRAAWQSIREHQRASESIAQHRVT